MTARRSMLLITLQILQYHQEPSPNQDQDFGTTPVIFHDSLGRTLVGAGHKNGNFYTYVLNNIQAGAIWTRSGGTSVGLMPAYDPTFGSGGTLFIAEFARSRAPYPSRASLAPSLRIHASSRE